MNKNYWEILGLPPNASQEQIKKAYRKKAFELHPDRNPAPDAEEKFIAISEAYEFLTAKRKLKRITTYNSTKWTEKVNEEARRQARMSYEEFRKRRKEQDYKETLRTRIIVITALALYILTGFIYPWVPLLIFAVAIVVGFITINVNLFIDFFRK